MKVSIVHYQPVEFYPPAMNLVNYLNVKYPKSNFELYTCKNKSTSFTYFNSKVKQFRYNSPQKKENSIKRVLQYFNFIILVTYHLFRFRPDHLIYYETNSAFPVFLYQLLTFRKHKLYIHYHEYNSKEQYLSGMKLVKLSYLIEKYYLWKCAWKISHTNKARLSFFQDDYPYLNNLRVIPNYPPEAWLTNQSSKPHNNNNQLKLIYIGSLSLENFYLKEICDWIITQNGNVILDIFSFNASEEAIKYVEKFDKSLVNIYTNGVWYFDLPSLLKDYHVGLILYRAFNQNFTFNETNKLFEYLSCGLDVLFSKNLEGIEKHISEDTYPQVVPVDFEDLGKFDYVNVLNRQGKKFRPFAFSAEKAFSEFIED